MSNISFESFFFLVGIATLSFTIPVIVARFGRVFLIALLPIFLLTANVLAESFTWLFHTTPFDPNNPDGILTSLAVPIYAGVFLITDIISERYGKNEALHAVWVGFLGQLFFIAILLLILNSPVIEPNKTNFQNSLGFMPKLVFASMTAYAVSQILDVYIFHKIREKTGGKFKWFRNVASTIVSQGIDSAIFLYIGFYGRPPTSTFPEWLDFLLVIWLVKVLVALFDTPFFLWATGKPRSNNE